MSTALIGHTGFVGGNLLRQGNFNALYHSANITQLSGKSYDVVWCSGVRSVKWWANKNPEEDWQSIVTLLDVLSTVRCGHLVLFSTVDVFKDSVGMTEDDLPMREGLHPYGLHRLNVEDFVRTHFPRHTIIRLPGLFGAGLKKNAVYDFLHDNQIAKIHADARFQFYDLSTVYADCLKALNGGLDLVHFAVEPISVSEMARVAFGLDFESRPTDVSPACYDLRTVHAGLFGKHGVYLQHREEVLQRLVAFVREEREKI